ncbi:MAG: helix-turn-helix domain-containing protein [Chitinophagales bacterium]
MSIIGKNIKKIRLLKNLNQQAMGDLLGIGRGSIGSYEEGRAEPKLETIINIAKHFNLNLDMFLTKELTVNDLSDFANKISKVIPKEEKTSLSLPEKEPTKLFLEQRVAILEEKIAQLEKLISKK